MSKRLRTPNLEASIRERARAGLSNRAIAKELGVSRQTVDRALAEATPAPFARTAPRIDRDGAGATPEPSDPPEGQEEAAAAETGPGREELSALLWDLARGLTDQAAVAKKIGDQGAYAALASKAQAALTACAKLAPPIREDHHEGQYVTHDAMARVAASVRAKLLERIARHRAGGGQ